MAEATWVGVGFFRGLLWLNGKTHQKMDCTSYGFGEIYKFVSDIFVSLSVIPCTELDFLILGNFCILSTNYLIFWHIYKTCRIIKFGTLVAVAYANMPVIFDDLWVCWKIK